MKTPIRILAATALSIALGLGSAEAATIVDAGNFTSTGSNQALNGTTVGITINQPGGNWMWGSGYNWTGGPQVNATWLGGLQNAVTLSNESESLGLSLASNGGYTKPIEFTISVSIQYTQFITDKPVGDSNFLRLGFWSAMGTPSGAPNSLTNFTGLVINTNHTNGSAALMLSENGLLSGNVALGTAISVGTFYNFAYTVNTSTGAISGISFNGSPVSAFSTTAFTDSATAFVGVASGTASRVGFDNLIVADAVPEPSTWALLLGGGLAVAYLRRARRS